MYSYWPEQGSERVKIRMKKRENQDEVWRWRRCEPCPHLEEERRRRTCVQDINFWNLKLEATHFQKKQGKSQLLKHRTAKKESQETFLLVGHHHNSLDFVSWNPPSPSFSLSSLYFLDCVSRPLERETMTILSLSKHREEKNEMWNRSPPLSWSVNLFWWRAKKRWKDINYSEEGEVHPFQVTTPTSFPSSAFRSVPQHSFPTVFSFSHSLLPSTNSIQADQVGFNNKAFFNSEGNTSSPFPEIQGMKRKRKYYKWIHLFLEKNDKHFDFSSFPLFNYFWGGERNVERRQIERRKVYLLRSNTCNQSLAKGNSSQLKYIQSRKWEGRNLLEGGKNEFFSISEPNFVCSMSFRIVSGE